MAFLALLPDIFAAVKKIGSLFAESKNKFETISGRPSAAQTPEELQREVATLSPEAQERWVDLMHAEISKYYAENARLDIEIGRITPELQTKVSSTAADKITILRQTTRPWAVRMAIHYLFFPVYLLIFDVLQLSISAWIGFSEQRIFRAFEYVFGTTAKQSVVERIGELIVQGQAYTVAGQLYTASIGWVVSIVISYMGLREIGKCTGSSESNSVKQRSILQGITAGIGKFFKK